MDLENNFAAITIRLPAINKPDLTFITNGAGIKTTDNSLLHYSIIAKNNGVGKTDMNTYLNFTLTNAANDTIGGYNDFIDGELAPGGIYPLEVSFELPHEGIYFLTTTLDDSDYIYESDETNNVLTEKILFFTITQTEKNIPSAGIHYFQNAGSDSFTIINNDIQRVYSYVLYNQLGEAIRSITPTSPMPSIYVECNGMEKGLYLLKAESSYSVKQIKMILN